jgi:hypothetical protein
MAGRVAQVTNIGSRGGHGFWYVSEAVGAVVSGVAVLGCKAIREAAAASFPRFGRAMGGRYGKMPA